VQGSFNIEFSSWTQQNCIDFRDGVIAVAQPLLTNFNANQDVSPCEAFPGSTIVKVTINKVPGGLADTLTAVFSNTTELRTRFAGTSLAGAAFSLSAAAGSAPTTTTEPSSKGWIAAAVLVPIIVLVVAAILVYVFCFKGKNSKVTKEPAKEVSPVDTADNKDKAPVAQERIQVTVEQPSQQKVDSAPSAPNTATPAAVSVINVSRNDAGKESPESPSASHWSKVEKESSNSAPVDGGAGDADSYFKTTEQSKEPSKGGLAEKPQVFDSDKELEKSAGAPKNPPRMPALPAMDDSFLNSISKKSTLQPVASKLEA
jgi:hypothetical protein